MERGYYRERENRRRRRCLKLVIAVPLVVGVVCVFGVVLTLQRRSGQFKKTFLSRCEESGGHDCETKWGAFQLAYVGRDPCKVPMEAYDPFIATSPFKPDCDRMMFWSKTKDVVHNFTHASGGFLTLEDTLLGSMLDDLTWCGKEGSKETFTTGCPGWTDCRNNTVRSFWNRASAAFAEIACGDVTAMLNGSITTPFNSTSIFATIEVKRFTSTRMNSLNVVLVTQTNTTTNCTNASLQNLQKELDKGIKYNCVEVAENQIQECISKPKDPPRACW